MNCRNCGAPLTLSPFSDVASCLHCGSHNAVPLSERGSDRIVWSRDGAGMDCPRCEDGLLQAFLESHPAKACPECHGVMLTNAAFAAIVRQRRAQFRGADRTPQPIDLEGLSDPVYCPQCRRTMEVHPYYGPGNQIIDSCVRCGLVWIDSGELTAIEHAPGRR